MEDEPKIFSTRDLYLASTLVTLHYKMLGVDLQIEGIKPRGIGYFKFDDTKELRDTLNDYNQGLILIEPRMYMNNLQSLKSTVVNFQQNPMSEMNRHAL